MSDLHINQAARLMRAGDAFSATNLKLRDALWSFTSWLYLRVGHESEAQDMVMRKQTGWGVWKKNVRQLQLVFNSAFEESTTPQFLTVDTDSDADQMKNILIICKALTGPAGERLCKWLEQENSHRNGMLEVISDMNSKFGS